MVAGRTISRFGRTFEAYDPDGSGGGPSTWILSSAGAGGGAAATGAAQSGLFTPSAAVGGGAAAVAKAGMALYLSAPPATPGSPVAVDLAVAIDALPVPGVATPPAPWRVVGLAGQEAVSGQLVGLVTDGQLALADWSAVTGTVSLTVGATYYLGDSIRGQLQDRCPTTAGSTVVSVGVATAPQILEVEINFIVRN